VIYESARGEALQKLEPPSWAVEQVRHRGVAALLPGFQNDFPFIVYAQSVPRPAWSGNRDFHREQLLQVYEFLSRMSCAEIQTEDAAVANIADALEGSGCFPVFDADLSVDTRLQEAADRRLFITTE
jgi:hypothetical protein